MNQSITIPNINNYHREIINNDLILTLRIPNIDNYQEVINNNELILTPIYNYISLDELNSVNLTKAEIFYCLIKDSNNEIISDNKDKNKWFRILIDIYKSLSASFILQNTTFNIKLTNENGNKGYYWSDEINMSVQHKDSKGTYIEIMKMINLNNYKIDIKIKLDNNKKINYKNF